eukprot:CAMPEP_0184530910 /NCGR_PEP_ID=MMETSP0198_2-20121128/13232_1 /TAXON_ID=1112570 /ORGANISM="Thraustochytrium sp., Strain LLF1b" /LENGTH=48 /DNA_ID= /DNA_START= /DNA_END= /DNA_ORIENTATION=
MTPMPPVSDRYCRARSPARVCGASGLRRLWPAALRRRAPSPPRAGCGR